MTRHYRAGLRFALGIAAVLMISLQTCPVARSQDPPPAQQTPPPSLGDIARKNREEKAAQGQKQASAKTTFTNDDVMSGKSGGLLGAGVPDVAGGRSTGTAFTDAMAKMDDAMQKLDLLGSLDHANLFNVATGGITADFPGRKAWEDRMVAARQYYVVHGKELIQATKGLMLDAKALHDAQPNLSSEDPRVKSFMTRLKANMGEAQKMESDFQAVAEEGHARAMQAGGR